MNPQRICHIHAGTHKTASTYIQSRLLQNRRLLARQNLIYEFPDRTRLKHKPLAAAAKRNNWKRWHRYLDGYTNTSASLLLSGEQFTRPLCDYQSLGSILEILEKFGYDLHVIVFIRPQLEYMNSMYVHSLRRLYYWMPFEEYVASFTTAKSGDIFNYKQLFEPLLEAGVRCSFLPFSRQYGDPFQQLTHALGLDSNRKYAPAVPGSENVQPGTRGVWLARLVVERLEKLGHNGRDLKNTGRAMRNIAERQDWHKERYFGFSDELAANTLNHYRVDNEAFARRVWNRTWQEVFTATPTQQCVYVPSCPEEFQRMEHLADQVVSELAADNANLARALRASA